MQSNSLVWIFTAALQVDPQFSRNEPLG